MIIGLTGGIGSGKSTVAKLFKAMGYPVYDSDYRAKVLYFLPEIKKQIIDLLGEDSYLDSKQINREYISKKVFNNSDLLSKLNSIIHPAVENDFKKFCEENKHHKHIIKETALLFEAGIYKKVDKIILVSAPVTLRIKRVMERDNTSESEVIRRINNQMPDEEKIPISDFVIYNNEESALIPQVLEVVSKLNHA